MVNTYDQPLPSVPLEHTSLLLFRVRGSCEEWAEISASDTHRRPGQQIENTCGRNWACDNRGQSEGRTLGVAWKTKEKEAVFIRIIILCCLGWHSGHEFLNPQVRWSVRATKQEVFLADLKTEGHKDSTFQRIMVLFFRISTLLVLCSKLASKLIHCYCWFLHGNPTFWRIPMLHPHFDGIWRLKFNSPQGRCCTRYCSGCKC